MLLEVLELVVLMVLMVHHGNGIVPRHGVGSFSVFPCEDRLFPPFRSSILLLGPHYLALLGLFRALLGPFSALLSGPTIPSMVPAPAPAQTSTQIIHPASI